ncbi:MAG: hypothetical protein V4544_04815 [Pseudomonadota bacterium]
MKKIILATFAFSALMTADVFAKTCPANRPSCSPEQVSECNTTTGTWFCVTKGDK